MPVLVTGFAVLALSYCRVKYRPGPGPLLLR